MTATPVHTGRMGRAEPIPVPDRPDAAETVTWWLITAPRWSPLLVNFHQWVLGVVRLRDGIPGFPPPKRRFDGATHELFVATVNPEHPTTAGQMVDPGYHMHPLEPMNVVEQFEATDDEMRQVADLAARAVVDGHLCPEAWATLSGSSAELSRGWLTSITKTLAHVRGEVHAP